MNIVTVDYNPETDAVEVFVSGCKLRCPGCHNRVLWEFDNGLEYTRFIGKLIHTKCDRVMVMGGEPQDQDRDDMIGLLDFLRQHYKEIWVFTGYNTMHSDLWSRAHWVKCGPYLRDVPGYTWKNHITIDLASCNQKITPGGLF